MNTKMISLIFFLSSFSVSLSINTHLENEELKGKVKSVKETSYRVKQSGNAIVKVEKEGESNSYREFNKQGNYKKIEYYKVDDSFIGKYSYMYDNDDNNIQINWSDSKGVLLQEHHYAYDRKGNANVYKMIYPDERGLYFTDSITYNNNDNKIKEIRYHPNNIDIINKKTFTYNKEGHKIEEKTFGNIKHVFQYKYNSKGKKIEQKEYDEHENLVSKINYNTEGKKIEENLTTPINISKVIYSYNTKGQLIETFQTDKVNSYKAKGKTLETLTFQDDKSNDKVLRELLVKYTYDEKGNWITKTTFIKENPRSLTEREIIYY